MAETRGEGTVRANLVRIRERIGAAAQRAGRNPETVQLLAVTKYVPTGRISEAVEAGQLLFGENRVQEAADKTGSFGPDVTWHMIGVLQKNKVKKAVSLFDAIESVDSLELARLIDRRAGEAGRVVRVFLQVKLAEEKTKGGVLPAETPPLIEAVCAMPNLSLGGLMTIPPWGDPEDARSYFAALRRFREEWDGRYCPGGTLAELSMGMTADFEVAIEEGATIVRVGSAIFGPRPLT